MSTLGNFERCSICGHYDFSKSHRCPPCFEVLCPEYDGDDWEEASKVYARDAEAAAERWAAEHDWQGDYDIVEGSPVFVLVRKRWQEGGEAGFVVSGEMQPTYNAESCTKEQYEKDYR